MHGAALGAWCWRDLTPHLRAFGYRPIAVDLPVDHPDAGAAEYVDACLTELDGHGKPSSLVVVAASMSGLIAPLIAQARPVDHTFYLDAILPRPGTSFAERRHTVFSDTYYERYLPTLKQDDQGRTLWPPDIAAEAWFASCTRDVADWATAQLRPQAGLIFTETTPLASWPRTRTTYIRSTNSPSFNDSWQGDECADLLGVRPIALDADHSPFLSRPLELATLLHELIQAVDPQPCETARSATRGEDS